MTSGVSASEHADFQNADVGRRLRADRKYCELARPLLQGVHLHDPDLLAKRYRYFSKVEMCIVQTNLDEPSRLGIQSQNEVFRQIDLSTERDQHVTRNIRRDWGQLARSEGEDRLDHQ